MRSAIFIAACFGAAQSAFAQVAVQQPVVGQTAVGTTVSVPDRGSIVLGGTTSGQMGRSQGGPLRSGTSSGIAYQSSSMTTHVTIHDLQAMDEALLHSRPVARGNASRAAVSQDLLRSPTQRATQTPTASLKEKSTRFEQLALDAERAGKPGVAKLFWQSAAKCGSAKAEKRLAELNHPAQSNPLTSRFAR